MALEIERKFLIKGDAWRHAVDHSVRMRQGYLANTERGSIRARETGDRGFLNLKSMTLGVNRSEFDYEIPVAEAREILDSLCMRPLIEKVRYYVPYGGHTWEIDVFEGENEGLIVAELELAAVDEPFDIPPWLGDEVSDDPRYYNVSLIEYPYKRWREGG